MDIFSVIIFVIYIIAILTVLLYISPLLSAFVLMLIPLASVYFLPEETVNFFVTSQFSLAGVEIRNIHILLSLWSSLLGIVAYTEILSWYLLRGEKQGKQVEIKKMHEVKQAQEVKTKEQKPMRSRAEDLLLKLGKIMSGKKSQ